MLLFIDGWDHLATADLYPLYYEASGNPGVVNSNAGRFGGNSFTPTQALRSLTVNAIGSSPAGLVVGFACINPTGVILKLTSNTLLMTLEYSSGVLTAFDSSHNPIASSTPGLIAVGTWAYIEMEVSGWGSVQTVSFQIDGAAAGSGTGNTGIPNPSSPLVFNYEWESGAGTIDDNYWFDTSGDNNTFAGVRRVDTRFVQSAGHISTWAPVGASIGADCVNDPTPDYDATYVATRTPGAKSAFTVAAPSQDPDSVLGVQIDVFARADDTDPAKYYIGVSNGSTDIFEPTGVVPATNYKYSFDVLDTNPFTSVAWAPGDVDNIQIVVQNANSDGSSG